MWPFKSITSWYQVLLNYFLLKFYERFYIETSLVKVLSTLKLLNSQYSWVLWKCKEKKYWRNLCMKTVGCVYIIHHFLYQLAALCVLLSRHLCSWNTYVCLTESWNKHTCLLFQYLHIQIHTQHLFECDLYIIE